MENLSFVDASTEIHSHAYEFSRGCATYVCWGCDDHRGLARCWCGWSLSGQDGRAELVELGETIEAEVYVYVSP